ALKRDYGSFILTIGLDDSHDSVFAERRVEAAIDVVPSDEIRIQAVSRDDDLVVRLDGDVAAVGIVEPDFRARSARQCQRCSQSEYETSACSRGNYWCARPQSASMDGDCPQAHRGGQSHCCQCKKAGG